MYMARPSVPVKAKASRGGGSKRNPVRQSHVITSTGLSRDRQERQERTLGPTQHRESKIDGGPTW